MKNLWELLFVLAGHTLMAWFKIQCKKIQVIIFHKTREVAIILLFIVLAFVFIFLGFIAIHIALFYLLPWSINAKLYILFALGLLYFFGATGVLLRLCSRSYWIQSK